MWYMKLFRMLLNVFVQNALIVYNNKNHFMDHLTFSLQLLNSLFNIYSRAVNCHKLGSPAINPSSAGLTELHFIEKISAFGKKLKP